MCKVNSICAKLDCSRSSDAAAADPIRRLLFQNALEVAWQPLLKYWITLVCNIGSFLSKRYGVRLEPDTRNDNRKRNIDFGSMSLRIFWETGKAV